jgi:hypothetical protein
MIETQDASYEVMNPEKNGQLVSMQPTSVIALQVARVEMDRQVTTAMAFPRARRIAQLTSFVLSMIKSDRPFAESCTYELTWIKVEKGPNAGRNLTGPSIRFAEAIVSAWQHTKIRSWIVETDQNMVKAACSFWDLENNTFEEKESVVGIKYKPGKTAYETEQKRINALKSSSMAAQSIAKRNVVLTGIPRYFWMPLYQAAVEFARGDEKELPERRRATISGIVKTLEISEARIYAALGVSGIEDINLDIYTTLRGLVNSVREEGHPIEDVFPPIEAEKTSKSDKLASELKPAAAKEEKKEETKKHEAEPGGKQEKKGKAKQGSLIDDNSATDASKL